MNAITVTSYRYSTLLGSASFPNIRVEVLAEGVTSETFDSASVDHSLPDTVRLQMDCQLAKDFLSTKTCEKDSPCLSGAELAGVEEFLRVDKRSFALLLGVSFGALSALLSDKDRVVNKYLSSRALCLLETELSGPGFFQKCQSCAPTEGSTNEQRVTALKAVAA